MKVVEDRPPSDKQSADRRTAGKRSRGNRGKRKIRGFGGYGESRPASLLHPVGKTLVAIVGHGADCVALGVFVHHYYSVYSKMIDERLLERPYSTTARIFAAPEMVSLMHTTTIVFRLSDLSRRPFVYATQLQLQKHCNPIKLPMPSPPNRS